MFRKSVGCVVVVAAVMCTPAGAQDDVLPTTTNPAQRTVFRGDKSIEDQQADQLYCYQWASTETSWNPEVQFKAIQRDHADALAQYNATQGAAVRGAAGGALAGLAIGAIAGDAGKGAAIGAVAGGLLRGGRGRRQQAAAGQTFEAAAEEFKAAFKTWDSHWTACMTGKAYGVG